MYKILFLTKSFYIVVPTIHSCNFGYECEARRHLRMWKDIYGPTNYIFKNQLDVSDESGTYWFFSEVGIDEFEIIKVSND